MSEYDGGDNSQEHVYESFDESKKEKFDENEFEIREKTALLLKVFPFPKIFKNDVCALLASKLKSSL